MEQQTEITPEQMKLLSSLYGKRGGESRSPRKIAASRKNIKKALASILKIRKEKRKLARLAKKETASK